MNQSNRNSVPSVVRALDILELLARSRRGLTISEMGRRLTVPKSSVHLIVTTLERRGYLQRNIQTGHYRMGLKLLSLSRTALDELGLRDEARPFLEALMKKTGLTVHMGVLERTEVVIVEKIESPGLIKLATWVGRRLDAHCTGLGKALLAHLPDEEFDALVKSRGLTRHNHKTIVSINKLKRELAEVRERGYSLDDEEDEIGLRCIGAAVLDGDGRAAAAISIAGSTAQISRERIKTLSDLMRQTAGILSQG